MSHVIQLSAQQQAILAPLKATLVAAQKAVRDAQAALNAHVAALVPASAVKGKSKFVAHQRVQVSDDGTALIVG